MRPLRAPVAFVFAMLVLFGVGGAGVQQSLLLCRSENTRHKTCCCKHRPAELAADEVRRLPCCDAELSETASIPPSGTSVAFAVVAPTLLEQLRPTAAVALESDVERLTALVPAVATGPPLVIEHRSLLI